jgi:amidase
MTELVFLPATQLARMIREPERPYAPLGHRVVSSVEVVDAYLQQIDRYNDKLHAICTLDAENARASAQEADEALARGENWGILHGVPITIKDTLPKGATFLLFLISPFFPLCPT